MKLWMWLIPAAVIGVPLQGYADPPKDEKKKSDVQDKFEPSSAPGEGQKYLSKFAGDWSVEKTIYPTTGDPERVKGECRQVMVQGGRFLQSDFTFGSGDEKTTGFGLIGFDRQEGEFTSVWADSRQTRMSLRKSSGRFDGTQIVLFSEVLGEAKPGGRRSKTVTKIDGDGNKIVHRQYSIRPAKDDRLVMELVMTRKAGEVGPEKKKP